MFFLFRKQKLQSGFTLIEVLIAVAIFLMISVGIYDGYTAVTKVVSAARVKTNAMLLSNEQIEIVRNMPYSDVGIVDGIPNGKIEREKNFTRGGMNFKIITSVRNIDDPFDGVLGSTTKNDLAPADYKQVSLDIKCLGCVNFPVFRVTTTVAPKNLEMATNNGALFVKVFDSNGNPVSAANVHIENNLLSPAVSLNETTNNNGEFQLIDVPPGNYAYEITVSKTGYSTSRTYEPGVGGNVNPTTPHSTVLAETVTQVSFSIDRLSTINFITQRNNCETVSGATFHLSGSKTIGTNPVILKLDQDITTDGSGTKTLNDLEWDTYNFSFSESSPYSLSGSLPFSPVAVVAGATQNITLTVTDNNPRNLLISVKDNNSKLPLDDAQVMINGGLGDKIALTSRGFVEQTDWSGGPGQDIISDSTKFYSTDSGIDWSGAAGELRLASSFGSYQSSGYLVSSVFDSGSASSTFYSISWDPSSQATSTGAESVKFQIATSNESATTSWDYLGPDGTAGSFYTVTNTNINSVNNYKRYIRYKIFLSTEDSNFTPNVSNVSITYGTECMPFGQVFFSGLSSSTYSVLVSRSGYQDFSGTVDVSQNWQQKEVEMLPQ